MNGNSNTLIEASNLQPAEIERRRSRRSNWSFKDRRRRARLDIGIEISPAGVSMAVISEADNGQRCLKIDFEPLNLVSCNEWTQPVITAALGQLVARNDLHGQTVYVGLGGNACVTRSFFGTNEAVDASCRELGDRASHYLALGRGEKVCCRAERMIDAKHKRAWVTVAQRSVIELVARSVAEAGLRLGRVEHTLTVLCQIAGQAGIDAHRPVLMILTGLNRSDMFITFQGQLLLDYRPTEHDKQSVGAGIAWTKSVQKHIKCLRRYLSSQLPRGTENLRHLCLPASDWCPTPDLANKLRAEDLELVKLSGSIPFGLQNAETMPTPELMAAIKLSESMSEQAVHGNAPSAGDLTASILDLDQISLRALARLCWPVAASLMLVLCGSAALWQKNRVAAKGELALEQLQPVRFEMDRLNRQLKSYDETIRNAGLLRNRVERAPLDLAIKILGRSLPRGCWLKQVTFDAQQNCTVQGISYSDDGVYEYLATLKDNPNLRNVSVVSVRPNRLPSGPAFEFEIKAGLDYPAVTFEQQTSGSRGIL